MQSTEERFAANVEVLFGLVKEINARLYQTGFPCVEERYITLITGVICAFKPRDLIQNFIKNSCTFWNMIREQNETFFLDNADQMFHLPVEMQGLFRLAFEARDSVGELVVSQQDREDLWALIQAMVKISIRHVAQNKALFSDLDIVPHAEYWGIQILV